MIRPPVLERFGMLSEAVQVKGAIAMAQVSRLGMHLDVHRLQIVQDELRKVQDELINELSSDPSWQKVVRRDRKGQIILTPKGQAPSLNQTLLRQRLELAATEVARESGRRVAIPRSEKGLVSLKAEDWEELSPFNPMVHAWLELVKVSKSLQFFGNLASPVIHPRYTPIVRTGRTSCSNPNVQNLPREGGIRESFVPSPGTVFLVVDYSFIELRTLAAVCEERYGSSKLAEVIRAGVDPHCHTAAMFEGMTLEEFMKLKGSKNAKNREQYASLRQRAKVLNFGIPGGLGPRSLVAYAKNNYGVILTVEKAEEFRLRLIQQVYPELALYLADDGMDVLARNLAAPVLECWQRFDRSGERSGRVVGAVRKIVQGSPCKADGTPYNRRFVENVWDSLIELNRNEELAPLLARRQGTEALGKLLFRGGVTTLTGRVRGRVRFTQARNTAFQGLASDGAKLALWALIKEGYRVVAFIHDEFLVELSENADHAKEAKKIETIVNGEMQKVTGSVPVACEYALARRWSKNAKPVFTPDGRLVPYELEAI